MSPREGFAVRAWQVVAVIGSVLLGTLLRADLVITEIHYAPRDLDDPSVLRNDLEFVEIFNDGPEVYDVSNFFFSRGITLRLPEGTFIPGRGYLVVCRDQAAVRDAYGITNTIGDFAGVLDNSGETIELSNPQGRPAASVRYNDRGRWPSGAKGTGHSLSILYEYLDPSDADNWALSSRMGGTPGRTNFNREVSFEERVLIPDDSVWRYFKGRENPPSTWRTPDFDDGSWLAGRTGIGYGDGDDRTELADMRDSYLTVFCRKAFTVDDPGEIDSLVMKVVYDDGFYAYLNGSEVGSRNVTGRDFDDPAGSAGEPELAEITIDKGLLARGSNLLAVQVHNANLSSSDLTFIPELVSRRTLEPDETETVPVVVNEGHFRDSGTRFIELHNTSDSRVDVSGYHLTDSFDVLRRFTIPAGTSIPGRGFIAFTEAQLGFDIAVVDGMRERIEVALTNPAGTRVVDARLFEPEIDGKSEARFPDGDRGFAPAAEPTPGEANRVDVVRDVIFNEIHYHSIFLDRDADEFIELFNRGNVARDIGGWRIDGADYELPPGTVIGPGEYLVVARTPSRIRTIYGLDEQTVVEAGFQGRLRNGGERLRLLDRNGNVADEVTYYDGGEWPVWADGSGSTLERIDPFGESSVATTWDASDDSDKAVTQTITYTATHGGGESDFGMMLMEEGIAIIDEIELTRTSGGPNLISNGTFDGGTSPWRIEGTHVRSGRTSDPAERISGSGSLKLICWNGGGDYKVNRIETDTGSQANGATYRITYRGRWVVGSPTILTIGDYNIGNPASAGLAGSNFFDLPRNLGTPGAVNSVTLRQIERFGSPNQGPAIDRVKHSPGVPEGGETVTVTARVRDPGGVSSVRLFHRTERPVGSFTSRAMSGPDADGMYRATIPGEISGTRVIFYIEATDGEGRTERFPKDIFTRTHPPVTNPSNPSPVDALYCMYRHDTRLPNTRFHSYRFILDEDRENELRSRRVLSNFALEGTFVFGSGDVYYNAGIRFAGSPWLRPSGGSFDKSYTIKMPKDNPLHGRLRSFNLDEHGSDGRERIAHYLLRRNAGSTALPYFDGQAMTRFQLNDVETGTYEAIAKPNRQYMEFWFPDETIGPHYEMDDRFSFNDSGSRTGNAEGHVRFPPYGSTSGGNDKENYRWYFALRNEKGGDDFNPLMQLCRTMDPRVTSNSVFDRSIFQVFDVEEVLRVWAIRLNIDDWDTWGGRRGKNCYLYQSLGDRLWRLVPWDLELTFGDLNAFGMSSNPSATYGNHFGEITRMINRPRVKRMYYGILKEQVDTFFFTGADSPLSAYASRLSGSGVSLGNTLSYVNSRGSMIRGWVRAAVYPQVRLVITTNGGADFAESATEVALEGDAPADIFSFVAMRNGEIVDSAEFRFSTSDMRAWSAGVPLVGGRNEVSILGFNSRGDLIDSDSIVVSNTAPFGKPVITEILPNPAAIGEVITIVGEEFHDGVRVLFNGLQEAEDVEFDEATDPTRIRARVNADLRGLVATVHVVNVDGQESEPVVLNLGAPTVRFVRGDTNLDGRVDISDPVGAFNFLYRGAVVLCVDTVDTDDNGRLEITDPIVTLLFLFQGGPAPAPPFPEPGPDPTSDSLDCRQGL